VELLSLSAHIPLIGSPTGFALTPDGTRAVVILQENEIAVADLLGRTPFSRLLTLNAPPVANAASPDGTRAFVVCADNKLDVVIIARGSVLQSMDLSKSAPARRMSLSHQRAAAFISLRPEMCLLSPPASGNPPIGQSLQERLDSCVFQAWDRSLPLGDKGGSSSTAVSQVIPANGGCTDELSSMAVAQNGAVVELLWSDSGCTTFPAGLCSRPSLPP
jgi:hypothetical protein